MANKISLDGTWQIKIDPEELGLAEHWAKMPLTDNVSLTVPGCIQQLDCFAIAFPPQNDMRNSYCGTYFMEKSVFIPNFSDKLSENKRCTLILGGVIPCCHVWVNGEYVSRHFLSVCRAEMDITEYLNKNAENRITVAVVEQHVGLSTGMRFSGHNWSGIYSHSYIQIGLNLSFKDLYLSTIDTKSAMVKGVLINSGAGAWTGEITACLDSKTAKKSYTVLGNSEIELEIPLDTAGLCRWSAKTPNLYELKVSLTDNCGILEEYAVKTGLRNITIVGTNICFDGKPQYFAGAGQEYFSPTICPLTDEKIIRRRYQALLDHGFNFFRCHTHVPTEEEFCIADEMGLMLDVEFGLVSNFNKTTPFEEGIDMLKVFVRQTRNHPSLVVYSLGNEGSQLMVDSYIERNRAKMGYKYIKENTTEQLAIIAFGMQGELPELPNDFETPHLWSDNFLWGYDGLTDIPWNFVKETTSGKPCIIHEYGKFGVWPDKKEEATYPELGANPDFGTQARESLKELGLSNMEDKFIKTSRKLSGICNRIILEEARSQPFVCGYALWLFFRRANANGGICNDVGDMYDQDPLVFKNGCNADVALLIDRGFKNRSFANGVPQTINFTVSNYGDDDISDAMLCWELVKDGKSLVEDSTNGITISLGTTDKACQITFCVNPELSNCKMELKGVLKKEGVIISQNSWDFWSFNTSCDSELSAYLHIQNLTTERLIKKAIPNAYWLSSVDSILIGCRSWRNPTEANTAINHPQAVVIADKYDETIQKCYENGVRVLLIDNGGLPENWIVPPISSDLGERDTGRFFSSFRAGWDKGNLLTVIEDNGLITGFPQEDFCDLQYYDIVQGARSVHPSVLETEFGTKPVKIIEAIAKVPMVKETESIVQDPNAVKEQLSQKSRSFNVREQGYLVQIENEQNLLTVCTLKLTDNIAGIELLKTIVNGLSKAK